MSMQQIIKELDSLNSNRNLKTINNCIEKSNSILTNHIPSTAISLANIRYVKMLLYDHLASYYIINQCQDPLANNNFLIREAYQNALREFPMAIMVRYNMAQWIHSWADSMDILKMVMNLLKIIIKKGQYLTDFHDSTTDEQKYLQMEADHFDLSIQKLIILYCQSSQNKDAKSWLMKMNYSHRLSTHVLDYQKTSVDSLELNSKSYLTCFENTFNADLLTSMYEFLKPSSKFWSFHNYNQLKSTGYFSYVYPLNMNPRNFIEHYIQTLFALIKETYPEKAKKIKYAEWWAHCRPHFMGHQMHYDSEDEGNGTVRHPLLSTVLYVSENENVGGPTLMTNQKLGQDLANKGWLVFPKQNRLSIFDANYLHGVVPGKLITPDSDSRRITFMVGFWDHITIKDEPTFGSSRPLPTCTPWLDSTIPSQPFQLNPNREEVAPIPIKSVWQNINCSPLKSHVLPDYEGCFQGF